MKNDSFVSQLPDAVQKDQVIEESRAVRKELTDSTLPILKNAYKVFTISDLKSNEAKNLQDTFTRLSGSKLPLLDYIHNQLPNLLTNLNELEEWVMKNFNEQTVKASISLKELNVLQFIGISGFVSSYTRKLVSLFYSAESSQFDNSGIAFTESFSKADIQWIQTNFLDYVNAVDALTIKSGDLEKMVKSIPEIHVNPENIRSVGAIQSNSKIDPLKLQYLNVTNNFVFRLMLRIAEIQADRYKLALEEKRMLEYRHLLLKRQHDGKADARLEKEITIIENRISRLTYKIRQREESND